MISNQRKPGLVFKGLFDKKLEKIGFGKTLGQNFFNVINRPYNNKLQTLLPVQRRRH